MIRASRCSVCPAWLRIFVRKNFLLLPFSIRRLYWWRKARRTKRVWLYLHFLMLALILSGCLLLLINIPSPSLSVAHALLPQSGLSTGSNTSYRLEETERTQASYEVLEQPIERTPIYETVVHARTLWADVMVGKPTRSARSMDAPLPREHTGSSDMAYTAITNSSSAGIPAHPCWEDVMNDVVVIVKTGHEVAQHRLALLRNVGWMSIGRVIPNLLVISDVSGPGVVGMRDYARQIMFSEYRTASNGNNISRTIESPGTNTTIDIRSASTSNDADNSNRIIPKKWFTLKGWRGDKDKNLPAFHLARRLYPGKNFYLMIDDDTYVFLDNFAEFVTRYSSSEALAKPLYTGKVYYASHCGPFDKFGVHMENRSLPRLTFAHGGSGIVLNGAAVEAMYPTIPECVTKYSSCWAGDMHIAFCLKDLGILSASYDGGKVQQKHFTPISPSKALLDKRYTSRWKSNDRPITFHKVPEKELGLLSHFERECIGSREPIAYSNLLCHLTHAGFSFPFA